MRLLAIACVLASIATFSPNVRADDPLQIESWSSWKVFGLSKVSANGKEGQDRVEYDGGLFARLAKTQKSKTFNGALAQANTVGHCKINGSTGKDTGSNAEVHGTAKGTAEGMPGDSNNVQAVGKGQMTLTYTGEEDAVLDWSIHVVRDDSDDDGNGILNPTADGFGSIDISRDGEGGLSKKLTLKPSKITWTEDGVPKETTAASKKLTGTFDLEPGDSIFINAAAVSKVNGVINATLHTGVTVTIAVITAAEEGELGDGPSGGSGGSGGEGSGGEGSGDEGSGDEGSGDEGSGDEGSGDDESSGGPGGPPPAMSGSHEQQTTWQL